MAFTGSFISYHIYKTVSDKNYYFAVSAACFFSVLAAAFLCLLELGISGTVSFTAAFKDMMSLHLIVALLETVATLVMLWLLKTIYECSSLAEN
jgi:cobalt/nickel transport system permease protein